MSETTFQESESERRALIGGRLLIGEEFEEYCERNGMCPMCGKAKVKERKVTLLGLSWTNIPIVTNDRGDIEVYKGYHISPRCYSLDQAKEKLGETDKKKSSRRIRRRRNQGNELTRSDRSRPEHQGQSTLVETEIGPPSNTPSDAIIDAEVKSASIISDDVTQNSGGSSSQEHQTSIGSGTKLRIESPVNHLGMPVHPQSPSYMASHGITNRSTDSPTNLRHSTGRVKTSSANDIKSSFEGRRPLANSDPFTGYRHRNARSTGDVCSQLTRDTFRRSTDDVAHLPSIMSVSVEEDPDKAAIRELGEAVDRLDAYDFLLKLDCHRAKQEVVRRGLQLMRELVFKIHQSRPEMKYVFPNDGWCKTIKSAMSEYDQNDNMQKEGAMTVLFICSVSVKYKADLLRNHNAKQIVTAMESFPSVEESCCIALECLTRKEGVNANWREEHAKQAFDGIKAVLSESSHSGTNYGILALYNLSCHENFRSEFVADYMRVIFSDMKVIQTFTAVFQDDTVPERVLEAGVSLLLRFWVRFMGDSTSESVDALLGALMGAMYIYCSDTFHQGILELLSNVPIPTSSDISWKQTMSDAIRNSMTLHATNESIQLWGLAALSNVFGDASTREECVVELDRIVESIIYAVDNFERNIDLQTQGCLALACICSSGDWCKEAVIREGGITAIANAFRSAVVNVDSDSSATAAGSNDLILTVCSALSSLALSGAATSELKDSNILSDLQSMIKKDGSYSKEPCVRTCLINMMSVTLVASDEVSNAESEYTFFAELIMQFLSEDVTEEEVQSMLVSLNAMASRGSGILDIVLSTNKGTGTGLIVDLLKTHFDNASIQEAGCALLANIYFTVPFEGEFDQTSDRLIGTTSLSVRTHSSQEISMVSSSLDIHKANAVVTKNACEALCNFICGMNVVSTVPDDIHFPEEVTALFVGIPKIADSVMAIHEDNPEVMKSVLRLILVTVRLLGEDELQLCSASLIARIFEIMLRFPYDEEIHQYACSVLSRFVSFEKENIDASAANAEGLRALLLSLQMDNEDVISSAVGVIASLLQRVFELSNDVLEIEEYVGCFVNCMHRFPESLRIQAEACSILASLATLNDSYVKRGISNEGGVNVIVFAMRTHRTQVYVLEHACRALGSIAEGIPDEILLSVREIVCKELLRALNNYANQKGIVCATLEALCEFCRRDEYFEQQILGANAIPTIVDAMVAQHLDAEDVQNAGCKLLWMLAYQNDENKQVLGAAGAVRALVSAMLAHITSTAVQKEALTALKHISRVSSNKESLKQNDAADAIRLTIYANLEEPLVISAALSALNDIAVDTSTREVDAVSSETMSVVLQAMRIHSSDREVQKIACWLLRSYTFNERNLSLMRSLREELLRQLIAASSSFPEECGERAQNILEKL